MCVLGDLRSIIVAHERRKRRHEHERTGHQVMQTLFVGRDADDAVDLKRLHDVREVADRLDEVVGNNRLEDVKFKVALACGEIDRCSIAHHLHGHHRYSFALRRVDLARHDGRTRFICRDIDFAETAAGAGSEPANIVGDLHKVSGKTRKSAFKEADCVMARESVELVGRILKGKTRLLREAFRNLGAKAFGGIDAGADSRAADSEFTAGFKRSNEIFAAVREHRSVTREFLTERERRSVLQVRTSGLNEILKFFALGIKRLFELFQTRQEVVGGFHNGHDREGRREGVIRRLRHIHMIVRMHQLVLGQILLVTEIAAENLDGAVGEHFVHIHVRLRARTRLPDDEREIAVKLALKGLVRRLNDGVGTAVV